MFHRLMIAMMACLFPTVGAYAQDAIFDSLRKGDSYRTVLGGYGATHVGVGKTREHLETLDLVFRYVRVIVSDIGSSWYSGRHELLIEAPITLVVVPDVAPVVGLNFLASWTFTAPKQLSPYLFAGGGPLYTEADIPGLGSNLNGNYQAGTGIIYRTEKGRYINIEYRLHHISNAGTKDPNEPLNSSKLLMGITFFQ